jgi:peptide/nickel transport system permease protein
MVERFNQTFLDQPLRVQYACFWRPAQRPDRLLKDGQPVLQKIWERFLNSLPLFIIGTLITWTISFPVGIRSAIFRGGVYDRSATFISYVLISVPGFFFAYVLIIFVVNQFQVPVIGMQTFGMGETSWVFRFNDRLWHMLLPSILGATGHRRLSRYAQPDGEVEGRLRPHRPGQGCPGMVHYKHALRNPAALRDHVQPDFPA